MLFTTINYERAAYSDQNCVDELLKEGWGIFRTDNKCTFLLGKPSFLWPLAEKAQQLADEGQTFIMEKAGLLSALEFYRVGTHEERRSLVATAVDNSKDPDSALRLCQTWNLLTDKRLIKYARQSQNPTWRMLAMLLEKG